MYANDYMYATLPEYWTVMASEYNREEVRDNDWLYLGIGEWTIFRKTDTGISVIFVQASGSFNSHGVYNTIVARPVLYLSSDVKIIDGSGTETNPYKLAL